MESVCICIKTMRSILSVGAVLLLPMALMGVKHVHQGASIQLMDWTHKLVGKSLYSSSLVYLRKYEKVFNLKKKNIFLPFAI